MPLSPVMSTPSKQNHVPTSRNRAWVSLFSRCGFGFDRLLSASLNGVAATYFAPRAAPGRAAHRGVHAGAAAAEVTATAESNESRPHWQFDECSWIDFSGNPI